MSRSIITRALALAAAGACALGIAGEARADDAVVKRAMEDELARSLAELKLGGSGAPYYMRYVVVDEDATGVSARLGALVEDEHRALRRAIAGARVGSPDEDNTNSREYFGGSGALVALDDDYAALRRDLWTITDAQYKNALEALARKRASRAIQSADKDKIPDFARAAPAQIVKDHASPFPEADHEKLRAMVLAVSRVFRDFPAVNGSGVDASVTIARRRVLTSEKAWVDERRSRVRLDVHADTFGSDGGLLQSQLSYTAADVAGLPAIAKIEADVRALAKNLADQRTAPSVEPGSATVLFEGPAAAQLAKLLLANPLSGQPVPRAAGESGGDGSASLVDKLGLQVAPKWLSVTDDPTALGPGKRLLFGGFDADDEAVAAEKVVLIDKGVVKGLLMSRTPRKEIPRSNGHGRGPSAIRASAGNLFVTVTGGLDRAGLLSAATRSAGPKGTVYIVRELAQGSGIGRGQTLQARVAFRLNAGKEEVVRGLSLEGFTPKKMKKDLIAAGKDAIVLDDESWGMPTSVVTPSLLFEDVDVGKPNEKTKRPPLYASPLASAGK